MLKLKQREGQDLQVGGLGACAGKLHFSGVWCCVATG